MAHLRPSMRLTDLLPESLARCFVGFLTLHRWGRVAATCVLGAQALSAALEAAPPGCREARTAAGVGRWRAWLRGLNWRQRRFVSRRLCYARPVVASFFRPGGHESRDFFWRLGEEGDAVWRDLAELRGVTTFFNRSEIGGLLGG